MAVDIARELLLATGSFGPLATCFLSHLFIILSLFLFAFSGPQDAFVAGGENISTDESQTLAVHVAGSNQLTMLFLEALQVFLGDHPARHSFRAFVLSS